MHLVGFTIEIYYDARLYERQICQIRVCMSASADGSWCETFANINERGHPNQIHNCINRCHCLKTCACNSFY